MKMYLKLKSAARHIIVLTLVSDLTDFFKEKYSVTDHFEMLPVHDQLCKISVTSYHLREEKVDSVCSICVSGALF